MLFFKFFLVQCLLAVKFLHVDIVVEAAGLDGLQLFLVGRRVGVEISFLGGYFVQKGCFLGLFLFVDMFDQIE